MLGSRGGASIAESALGPVATSTDGSTAAEEEAVVALLPADWTGCWAV